MNSELRKFHALFLIATMLGASVITQGMTLALRKAFVKKYRDKVTISTSLRVDEHHDKVNAIDEDGDIHMAGRDTVILLPLVAEILNGRNEKDTMDFLLGTAAGQSVDVTGVWRLWFEHPSAEGTLQTQGDPVKIPDDSNPKHLFEIHPITNFGGFDCLNSFLPIVDNQANPSKEYRGHPATTAFPHYEGRKLTVWRSNTAIMLDTKRAYYNYTGFFIKLATKPKDVGDGYIVSAEIFATNNFDDPPLVVGRRRMIFAKDSPPANKVKDLRKGATLHVLGIPRVNLHEVFLAADNLEINEPDEIRLPYEMIIVGILED